MTEFCVRKQGLISFMIKKKMPNLFEFLFASFSWDDFGDAPSYSRDDAGPPTTG